MPASSMWRRLQEFPAEKWDAILAINLSSAFHTTRLALPSMLRNKWGRIINIASAHGLVASPFKSAYVAAKHGIVGLTKVIALETAEQGITCNAICPGYVYTPLVEAQIDGAGQGARHPARAGDPRRAARAAAEQAIRHGRRARRACRFPGQRRRGVDHRRGVAGRWRLDRALSDSAMPGKSRPMNIDERARCDWRNMGGRGEQDAGRHGRTVDRGRRRRRRRARRSRRTSNARSSSSFRAAVRSAPIRPASIRRCTRPASSRTGSSAPRSAPSMRA